MHLLQWHEARGAVGTKTWTTVTNSLVRKGEFGQVVTNHISLNINNVEDLAVVDSNNRADHFWHDDHITKVSLDGGRLFQRTSSCEIKRTERVRTSRNE